MDTTTNREIHTNNRAIVTITLARNREEEKMLYHSLTLLSGVGLPLFVTDGGSSELFLRKVKALPGVHLFTAKGLWPQAKKSLVEAERAGADILFYTEPDKADFFQRHVKSFWYQPLDTTTGVCLASRSPNAFASFPPFQQQTERAINECCTEIIGQEVDYCYGPFLFRKELLPLLDKLPDNCGWGWRPYLFAAAHFSGLRVESYSADFWCPENQQNDSKGERIYRMKQLTQNIQGIIMATARESLA